LEDPECAKIKQLLKEGKTKEFCLKEDGLLTHFKQVCVLGSGGLRKEIMSEAHCSPYTVHLGGTEMYRDVKRVILVEQYEEGHCEVCGTMSNLPISEGKTSKADRNAQAVTCTEVEVGQDCYGFYLGLTQGTHWRRFHLGSYRSSNEECSLHSHEG
jgi:hypothetical protein